ncbi:MAG: GGDEF-domain containing protein, partial [Pseudomonadota bacterium]
MVESLYANPLSLLIGAVCGSGICFAAALTTGDPWLKIAAGAVTAVALVRVVLFLTYRNNQRSSTTRIELLFELGAFTYAALLSGV